jgi:hypothetical protein
MDIKTGMVGVAYRISYQAMKEDIYTEPAPGRTREPVSTDQLFRAVRVLEAAGLVAIRSVMATKRLVFQCLLIAAPYNVKNKAATNPRLKPATYEASDCKAFNEEAATLRQAEAATHQRSEYTSTYIASSSSTTSVGTGPQGGQKETPDEIAPQGGAEGPHGAAEPSPEENQTFELTGQSKASAEGKALFFPSALNTDQRQAIELKISKLGERQQVVLDELAGFMGVKEIHNPVRYVDFIIAKAINPVFVPELAGRVRAAREKSAQVIRAAQLSPPPAPRAAPPAEFFDKVKREFLRKTA